MVGNYGKRKKPEKPEKSEKLHVTYQIKAYGMLVHAHSIEFQNFGKILGERNKDFASCIAESHAADRPLPGEWTLKI